MIMENKNYIVYIKIDKEGHITDINSSAFLKDTFNWIAIDEGFGDKYHHAQNHYFEKPLYAENNTHNYIYEDGKCHLTTNEEKAIERASFPIPEPSPIEKLQKENESLKQQISNLEDCLIEVGQIIYA